MPAPVREVQPSRTFGEDRKKRSSGQRIWHALASTEEAAIEGVKATAGWDIYPTRPEMKFDRIDAVPNDRDTGYTVTVSYSTFDLGTFQVPPVISIGDYRFGWGQRRVTVEIPASVRVDQIIGDGQQAQRIRVWTLQKLQVVEIRVQRKLKVRVDISRLRDLDRIPEQTDKVHVIYGAKWLFVGGDVTENDDNFDVGYTWERDNGTQYPPGVVNDNDFNIGANRPTNEPLRKPYHRLIPVPGPDPSSDVGWFGIREIREYGEVPDGWRALPGTEVV